MGLRENFSNARASGRLAGVIDTNEKLAAFLPVVKSAVWVALDTEAAAYPEKVCLIQISTVASDRLVDPLADMDINPLLDALTAHELIFHAADYDLRLLLKHHQFTPSAIFDTMLAARLLGEKQFGLGALVEKFLGVKLDKGPQKADWAQRPLTPRMEVYARNDTLHLKPIADKLQAELIAKNRLAWHQESCARLIVDCSQPVVVNTRSAPSTPSSPSARTAAPESASIERSSGILWSSASPVQEVNAVGMHSSVPFGFSRTNAGLVGSQAV